MSNSRKDSGEQAQLERSLRQEELEQAEGAELVVQVDGAVDQEK